MSDHVDSAGDDVRHQYRVLDNTEKFAMVAIKDTGLAFLQLIDDRVPVGREAEIAKDKIREAVTWAVKGITR